MASALLFLIPLIPALWPSPKPTERITLLPNADGRPSAVVITSAKGDTMVDRPYLSASVYASGDVTPKDEEPDLSWSSPSVTNASAHRLSPEPTGQTRDAPTEIP